MASSRPVARARASAATAADDAPGLPQPLPPPLTAEMRKATRTLHHAANALILAKLAIALHDRATYGRALASFLPVYAELERLLREHEAHATLGPVARAALPLARTTAMEEDVAFLLGASGGAAGGDGDGGGGASSAAKGSGEQDGPKKGGRGGAVPGWRWAASASAAAQGYAAHLRALAEEEPALLLPYAWSLYVPVTLGFMGQRVAKGLGLPPPGADEAAGGGRGGAPEPPLLASAGLRFFDLRATTAGGLDGREALARLRAAVDGAGEKLPPALRRRVVDEAREQFRRNNAVVIEFPLGVRDVGRAAARAWVWAFLLVGVVVLGAIAAAAVWARR
jgi:heme oxygenase